VRSATQERLRLADLLDEREAALRSPLARNCAYMEDLEADIAHARAAFVGASITEVAILRAELFGRPQG
jgi:hypothetical protein